MFYALDDATGKPLWSYNVMLDGNQRSFHGRMLFSDSLVYVGTDVPSGHVYAFNKRSGKVQWKYYAGLGIHGDIVGSEDYIYVLTKEDTLVCLTRKTGSVVWKFHTGTESKVSNNSSPTLADDRVYFRGTNSIVYALDAASGDPIWKKELPGNVCTSVILWDKCLYVGSKNEGIYRLKAETGEIEATLVLEKAPYGTMACTGNHLILFIGQYGQGSMLVSVGPDLNEIHWGREALKGTKWTTYRPYICNDEILVGDGLGNIFAFRIADGEELWSIKVEGIVKTISRYNNRLLIGTKRGLLYSFSVEQ